MQSNECVYHGQINSDYEKHGRGITIYHNETKNLFDGIYCQNKKVFGRLYLVKKEEVYEGFFDHEKYAGNGYLYNRQSKYKGKFANGMKNGYGYEISEN